MMKMSNDSGEVRGNRQTHTELLLFCAFMACFFLGCHSDRSGVWVASRDNGDKPGVGFVIRIDGENMTGSVFLLDPSYPDNFEKGVEYKMTELKKDGSKYFFSAVLSDGFNYSRTLEFQKELEGSSSSVNAVLFSDKGKNLGLYKFRRTSARRLGIKTGP